MPGSFSHMPHRGKSLVAKNVSKKILPHWGNTSIIEHFTCCPNGAMPFIFTLFFATRRLSLAGYFGLLKCDNSFAKGHMH
jgi:hypothetical protein